MDLRPASLGAIFCFTAVQLACASKDGTTGPNASSDPVDLILNAQNKGSHSNHWEVSFGSALSGSSWSFFRDGTGVYRQDVFAAASGQGMADFTWTRLGPDALLVNLSQDGQRGPFFTNFSSITGSLSAGTFTANLDGNSTRRTFVLKGGALP